MNHLKRIFLTFAGLLILALNCAAYAQQGREEAIEAQIAKDSPWVVYLDLSSVLETYLRYPGSTMASPVMITVRYQVKDPKLGWGPIIKYEDIWYKDGKAIGLRRYSALSLEQDGAIYIKRSAAIMGHTDAIANSICRVLLDIFASKGTVRAVFIPKEIADQIEGDFGRIGFHKFTVVRSRDKMIVLHLSSFPAGFDKFLGHKGGGMMPGD